ERVPRHMRAARVRAGLPELVARRHHRRLHHGGRRDACLRGGLTVPLAGSPAFAGNDNGPPVIQIPSGKAPRPVESFPASPALPARGPTPSRKDRKPPKSALPARGSANPQKHAVSARV